MKKPAGIAPSGLIVRRGFRVLMLCRFVRSNRQWAIFTFIHSSRCFGSRAINIRTANEAGPDGPSMANLCAVLGDMPRTRPAATWDNPRAAMAARYSSGVIGDCIFSNPHKRCGRSPARVVIVPCQREDGPVCIPRSRSERSPPTRGWLRPLGSPPSGSSLLNRPKPALHLGLHRIGS